MPQPRSRSSSRTTRSSGNLEDDDLLAGWSAVVDRIIRGDRLRRPTVVVGSTPPLLMRHGLRAASMTMTVAKVARCRREHPEVPLIVWRQLPRLLEDPLAIFPSERRDGTMVIVLVVQDLDGKPVLVAITPNAEGGPNAILSVYGKTAGMIWIAAQLSRARAEGHMVYEKNGFAASMPQPPVAEATSSSHGPIPSDGTTKPKRDVLSVGKKSI